MLATQTGADYVAVVTAVDGWPATPMLLTERLELESLRADHAEEIAPLFDDQRLHVFIGGSPVTVDELRPGTRGRLSAIRRTDPSVGSTGSCVTEPVVPRSAQCSPRSPAMTVCPAPTSPG